MPITHAYLVNNTANFVRDYPFIMERAQHPAGGNPAAAPANAAYNLAAFTGILANIHINYPANAQWFTVNNAPAAYNWGYFANAPIKAEMSAAAGNPGAPGPAANGRAFMLPWRTGTITSVTLGNNATFFFTAPLSGCKIYIDRVGGGAPTVYHANAGNIAANRKEHFMDLAFRAASGHQHNAALVKTFETRKTLMALTGDATAPRAMAIANRKSGPNLKHGRRRDVKWRVTGANVMGRRTGFNAWDFYWQVLGVLEYKRPKIDFNLKRAFGGNRNATVTKYDVMEVMHTGLL